MASALRIVALNLGSEVCTYTRASINVTSVFKAYVTLKDIRHVGCGTGKRRNGFMDVLKMWNPNYE